MQFILSNQTAASDAVSARIISELEHDQRVLWLVSGGSNIAVAATIMQQIPEELSTNLRVMPIDERFGPPGHANSNWEQLMQAGFEPKQAQTFPILEPGQNFAEAANYFESVATEAFADNSTCIALVGMGTDGHIAGILPHSEAVKVSDRLVSAYASDPYQRLTLTFSALERITAAYALAFGDSKREQLIQLRDQPVPTSEQPAQFLKQLNESYMYNDQIGEAA